ncbi:hypothetical protein D3C75_782020 [compost metagenome]
MAGKGIVILFIRLKIPDPAGSGSRRIPVEAADMLILSIYNYCIVSTGRYRIFTLLIPFKQPHSRIRQQFTPAGIEHQAERIGMGMSAYSNARPHRHVHVGMLPALPGG